MKKIIITYALLIFLAGCQTVEEKIEEPEVKLSAGVSQELDEIKKLYVSPTCYSANFVIETRGKENNIANGSMRIDSVKQRMRFVFNERFLGITLSQVTIADEKVFITSPRENGALFLLSEFEVRGLGFNNIRMPFRLFQDLLYVRIPEEVFLPKTKRVYENGVLTASLSLPGEYGVYVFKNHRLRELHFSRMNGEKIDTDLKGQFQKTLLPSSIEMKTVSSTGQSESLKITFVSYDPKARCVDDLFPMKSR